MSRSAISFFLHTVLVLLAAGAPHCAADDENPPAPAARADQGAAGVEWRALFNGRTLADWKPTEFGGEGDVTAGEGEIRLDFGSPLTGITYTGKELPRTNYEIALEAKKIDGVDFFCALTFPVEKSHCSFVVGGWAGAVVGLSSIDGKDASENETTRYRNFDSERWYQIRVRVTPQNISAWIDDKQMVDQKIVGRKISTRGEVDLSAPLGIAAFETRSALRKIRIRELARDKVKP